MKNLLMFSGGIDSTVVASYLKKSGVSFQALYINFNSRRSNPIPYRIAEEIGFPIEEVGIDIEKFHKVEEDNQAWKFYCGYGMLKVTIAIAYADKVGATIIHTGEYDPFTEKDKPSLTEGESAKWAFSKDRVIIDSDVGMYQDILPIYKKLYSLYRLNFNHPLQGMLQSNVIRMGQELRSPFALTFSCEKTPLAYEHCGKCVKCLERKQAFRDSGVIDPTNYEVL